MKYIFNLKSLIDSINEKPIWLRYSIIKNLVTTKYTNLDYLVSTYLIDVLLDYANEFLEYRFNDGTEYIITERI